MLRSCFSRRSFWVSMAVMLLAALIVAQPIRESLSAWHDPNPPLPSWVGVDPSLAARAVEGVQIYDIDTHLIHGGLIQAPRLVDTLRWWHGTWAGQVPFYRPLTSMLFWGEWKAWGDREARYKLVGPCIHVAASGSLFFLALALYRRFKVPRPMLAAVFGSVVFATGFGLLPSQPDILGETTALWKNQPDCLTLLWFCLCLTSHIRDQNRRKVSATPLIFYILVCLTKEAGIFLPLLLPILELQDSETAKFGKWRMSAGGWRRMAPLLISLPVYLLLRAAFLHDPVGYRYGSNSSWTYRLVQSLFGPVSEAFVLRQWVPFALCGYAVIVSLAYARRTASQRNRLSETGRRRRLVLSLLGLLIVGMTADFLDVERFDLIGMILTATELDRVTHLLQMTAFLIFFVALVLKRPRLFAVLYAWVLLSVGLTLFSPSVLHRYYLVNASFALILGAGASCTFAFVRGRFERGRGGSAAPA